MKQFLRYQVSGMVFILWIIIFYYGSKTDNTLDLLRIIVKTDINLPLSGLVSALPIGVLIHQLSVVLKNCVVAKIPFGEHFSDHPVTFAVDGLYSEKQEYTKYLLERVSNLNTFYYVRVDNGLLAPLLACFFCICFLGLELRNICSETVMAVLITIVTLSYLPRISQELKYYQGKLLSVSCSVKHI